MGPTKRRHLAFNWELPAIILVLHSLLLNFVGLLRFLRILSCKPASKSHGQLLRRSSQSFWYPYIIRKIREKLKKGLIWTYSQFIGWLRDVSSDRFMRLLLRHSIFILVWSVALFTFSLMVLVNREPVMHQPDMAIGWHLLALHTLYF